MTQERDAEKFPSWIVQAVLAVFVALIGWGLRDTIEQIRAMKSELVKCQTDLAVLRTESAIPRDPPAWFVKQMDEIKGSLQSVDSRLRNIEANRHGSDGGLGGINGPILGYDGK